MTDCGTEARRHEGIESAHPGCGAEGGAPASSAPLPVALLEPATAFKAPRDSRPHIPPPPPVSLLTVEDAHLRSSAGWECELDAFYVGLLQFERDRKAEGIVYKADNFRIVMHLIEGPVERNDQRMLGVVVKSLDFTAQKLRDAEIEFERERGLFAGEERLVLTDPAGNWIKITSRKPLI